MKQYWHPPNKKVTARNDSDQHRTGGAKNTPQTAGVGEEDEVEDISEEEGGADQKSSNKGNDDTESKVRTLKGLSAFRELDEGVIRDVLEANNGSVHLTMEALKLLVSPD